MTIEYFKSTRRFVDCIGSVIRDSSLVDVAGWIYVDRLFIEKLTDGTASLLIGNTEQSGTLETLEVILHEWAASEIL